MNNIEKIKNICNQILDRIEGKHITCFGNTDKPLFLISTTYCGIWLEHVYDSVFYAQMNPAKIEIAKNTLRLFIEKQTPDGQLPFRVMNMDFFKDNPNFNPVGYSQTQECVSFGSLCLSVYEMSGDQVLLNETYNATRKWVDWLSQNRMTSGRGLIEMFCGYDTGHDESARLEGLTCPHNYVVNGQEQNAAILPPNDPVVPILAVDMNCNYYGNLKALEKMAAILGKPLEAEHYRSAANDVKKKLFALCFDDETAFFYDVDKNGNKRMCKSCTLFHLFMEKVLSPSEDAALISRIIQMHIKNPSEFWTPFPFPSMAANDPSFIKTKEQNCWGYFSQALLALRSTLWMDDYGLEADLDHLCEQWLTAWTNCFDTLKLGQELDPFTGLPSGASEWYSSCMLFFLFSAKRLKIYNPF